MEDFFNDAFEYNIFKKALKATDGEPVIINLLSTDSSLKSDKDEPLHVSVPQRKNMSEKFEPSPFGKYFGSRKKRTAPVDMNNFSAWKNKNYRKVEEASKEEPQIGSKTFSLSDYMKSKSDQKYTELDQAKTDLKKPITQLSSDDPDFRKFALDSYMHKLEEGIIAKDKFEENDDLLEPISSFSSETDTNSMLQDEDFSDNRFNVEKVAFDDFDSGDKYSLNKNELDEVKNRLERLEREANNIKEKPTHKIITGDEFKETTEEDNEEDSVFSFSSLIGDDELDEEQEEIISSISNFQDKEDDSSSVQSDIDEEASSTETHEEDEENDVFGKLIAGEDYKTSSEEASEELETSTVEEKTDAVEDDENSETNQLIQAMAEYPDGSYDDDGEDEVEEEDIEDTSVEEFYDNAASAQEIETEQYDEDEDSINKNDILTKEDFKAMTDDFMSQFESQKKAEEKVKKAEAEKEQAYREYQDRLKSVEESYNKKYEEIKQKMLMDKLENDKKLSEFQNKFRLRESSIRQEQQVKPASNMKEIGLMYKKQLKSNYNISNLESDKKLLQISNRIKKEEEKKLKTETETNVSKKTTSRKTSSTGSAKDLSVSVQAKARARRRRSSNRRRIDSDIIGSIDFE